MVIVTDAQKEIEYRDLLQSFKIAISDMNSKQEMFDFIIRKLSDLPHFQWTGIYEYDAPKEELTLYPVYVGSETDHIIIPKGKGVCGTAVAKNEDIIVDDVTQLDNYLACSSGTKSEIVILIKSGKEIYGQIDIDSDEVGAFTEIDQKYLKEIADLLGEKIRNIQ
jgi:GAF domain-containing protein